MTWMSALIQAILIVAAMSSLNSGLYSTGRVLRSLGMSKQAPKFTLKMSSSGVPWAGIVMTSVVFIFGAVLNFLVPDAFEIALEAAAIGVLFTWGTIFVCQLRLRKLVNRGVIPNEYVPGARLSVDQLHRAGLPRPGGRRAWRCRGGRRSPVLLAQDRLRRRSSSVSRSWRCCLTIGWLVVRTQVIANTGGRLKAVWSDDGPTYGPTSSPGRSRSRIEQMSRTPSRQSRPCPAYTATGMTTSGGGQIRRGRPTAIAISRPRRAGRRCSSSGPTRDRQRCPTGTTAS